MSNVPAVTFGPTGFIAPLESQILAGTTADINEAFGGGLNPGLSTPQGQIASSEAAIIGNVNDTFLFYTQQVDPAYATGRMQDAIARIYFIERDPAEPTVLQIACNGGNAVSIPVGALIRDQSGNIYSCTEAGTIPLSGSVTLSFANNAVGPLPVPQTNAVSIYQAIPGWDSVTVVSGVVGNNTESRAAFEARRAASVALNSVGSLPAIRGAVLSVPGVLDAYVTENPTAAPVTIGDFTLAANSLYVAVFGGAAQAVGQAIWTKKAPGCAYNGNTTVAVLDTSPGYSPPYPSYSVTFEIPTPLPILFAVNIANSTQVPSNAKALVQNALLSAFAGGDGGSRARIGSTLYASRYYAPVASLGAWAQIISLLIGSPNAPGAIFTGSISGNALTVGSLASGTIAIGQTLTDATGNILPGTVITGGSGSSWTLSISQAVASETITSASPNANSAVVQIDDIPTLAAGNIAVTFT